MTKKKEDELFPPEVLKQYDKLISNIPGLERKGATMPYTSLNGNMFSFLAKDGSLGLRLSTGAREDFINKFNTRLCEANGAILKEYVSVPGELFINTKMMKKYFDQSYEYAKSLKPKPSKKLNRY